MSVKRKVTTPDAHCPVSLRITRGRKLSAGTVDQVEGVCGHGSRLVMLRPAPAKDLVGLVAENLAQMVDGGDDLGQCCLRERQLRRTR